MLTSRKGPNEAVSEYGYLGTLIGYILTQCGTGQSIQGRAFDSANYNVIVRSGDVTCPIGG